MKANKQGINAKLFKYFYDTDELPNNLCPYFWKLILAWVLIIPFSVFSLPAIVFCAITKERQRLIPNLGVSFVFYIACWIVVMMFYSVFSLFPFFGESDPILVFIGFFLWCILLTGLYGFWRENRKTEEKERKPNIIVEYYKGVKNKYCPTIEWE